MHGMMVSLARGGEGLGTMWGRRRAQELFRAAGFTQVEVHTLEHDVQNAHDAGRSVRSKGVADAAPLDHLGAFLRACDSRAVAFSNSTGLTVSSPGMNRIIRCPAATLMFAQSLPMSWQRAQVGGSGQSEQPFMPCPRGDGMVTAVGPDEGWLEDPTGRFGLRYWNGFAHTDWVVGFDGQVIVDLLTPAPVPVAEPTSPPSADGRAAGGKVVRVFAPPDASTAVSKQLPPPIQPGPGTGEVRRHTDPAPRHAGDAVLSVISKVTLQTWFSDRMSTAFGVPLLVKSVKERPGDPLPVMWLGLRLQELERTKQRMRRAVPPLSVTGAVLRPVLRPAMKKAATAISSGDGRPASQKVLSAGWQLLQRRIAEEPRSASDVSLMARNYLAGGAPDKAWEVAAAGLRMKDPPSEAFYVLAEAMFECGDHENARVWSAIAIEHGCTLGYALQRADAPFRRNAWTTTKRATAMPTANDFSRAKRHYYEAVSEEQLTAFYGPPMNNPEVRHGV